MNMNKHGGRDDIRKPMYENNKAVGSSPHSAVLKSHSVKTVPWLDQIQRMMRDQVRG